jgi:hypothetical protein
LIEEVEFVNPNGFSTIGHLSGLDPLKLLLLKLLRSNAFVKGYPSNGVVKYHPLTQELFYIYSDEMDDTTRLKNLLVKIGSIDTMLR